MSANGISNLEFKRQRQETKLALAAIDRAATGRRSTLDLSQLPSVYAENNNNTNLVIDNANNITTGGEILDIVVLSPLSRLDGKDYNNPNNVTIQFSLPTYGDNRAEGIPIIEEGKLVGIQITKSGSGYTKYYNVPVGSILYGQVQVDVFVIDSTIGDPDSRELADKVLGLNITCSDIQFTTKLIPGRPWK